MRDGFSAWWLAVPLFAVFIGQTAGTALFGSGAFGGLVAVASGLGAGVLMYMYMDAETARRREVSRREAMEQAVRSTPATLSATRYFLTPASDRPPETAADAIRRQLRAGSYSWGERTPHVRDLTPGDRIAFYAALTGVVAEAEVASSAEHSGRAGETFPWRFRVRDAHFINPPVRIDEDLRRELDWFEGKETSGHALSSLVWSTREISAHDFKLLTGS